MSGLNDDVDDGLDFSPEVEENNPDQPMPEKKLFVVPEDPSVRDDNPSAQDLFGENVVKNEVPNLKAEFVLVQESMYKVSEIFGVSKELRKANAISCEDAMVIDSLMPGFLNEERPIGFFTQDKSRTQLNETLNTINKTIDTQVAELAIKSSEVAQKAIKALSSCVKDAEPKLINRLLTLSQELSKAPEFLAKTPTENYHAQSLIRLLNRNIDTVTVSSSTEPDSKEMEKNKTFVDLFNKQSKFISIPRNQTNISLLLMFASAYSSESDNVDMFHMVTFGTYSPIKLNDGEYPIMPHVDSSEVCKLIPDYRLYHLFLGGCSAGAKEYLMRLVNSVVVLIDCISKRKQQIDEIAKSQESDHQKKLNTLFELHSQTNIDSMNSVILLTFVQEYCDFIESISKAIEVLLPAQELS